jgi:hypothetical protein
LARRIPRHNGSDQSLDVGLGDVGDPPPPPCGENFHAKNALGLAPWRPHLRVFLDEVRDDSVYRVGLGGLLGGLFGRGWVDAALNGPAGFQSLCAGALNRDFREHPDRKLAGPATEPIP